MLCGRMRRANQAFVARWARTAAIAAILPCAGCAAPALLVTAGFSAAREGTSAWNRGELAAAELATLDEVRLAVLAAMERLRFEVATDRLRENTVFIRATALHSTAIKVSLTRQSEAVTTVRIRIGAFGDQPLSRLILHEIERQLDARRAAGGAVEDGTEP